MWILLCEGPQRLRTLKLRMLRIKPIYNHHMPPEKIPHQRKILLRTFKTVGKFKVRFSFLQKLPTVPGLQPVEMLTKITCYSRILENNIIKIRYIHKKPCDISSH